MPVIISFQRSTRGPSQCRKDQEKMYKDWKGKNQMVVFPADVNGNKENTKESINKILGLIREFSKTATHTHKHMHTHTHTQYIYIYFSAIYLQQQAGKK